MMVFRTGEWAFGANLENIYTKACFFTVLYGDFELVRDSQNPSDKETFFSVFCHVFYTSKYLGVMELRDTKFKRKAYGLVPLEHCLVSVGSTWC